MVVEGTGISNQGLLVISLLELTEAQLNDRSWNVWYGWPWWSAGYGQWPSEWILTACLSLSLSVSLQAQLKLKLVWLKVKAVCHSVALESSLWVRHSLTHSSVCECDSLSHCESALVKLSLSVWLFHTTVCECVCLSQSVSRSVWVGDSVGGWLCACLTWPANLTSKWASLSRKIIAVSVICQF